MRVDELEKAKWKPLFKGVDYISTEKTSKENSFRDSVTIRYKGMKASAINGRDIELGEFKFGSNSIVADLLKNTLKESGAGYLRISFGTFVNFSGTPKIFLKNEGPEKYFFVADSLALIRMPGIRSVRYISKDEAKKVYLADGGEDWTNILDENPLPDAIEVKLEYREWTKESLGKLESGIMQKIATASDFVYSALYEPDENIRIMYYYVYKRN